MNCRTFEISLCYSYQPTCIYASLITSDHIVVLSDQNGDLVGHCPFKKKKAICSSDKEENSLKVCKLFLLKWQSKTSISSACDMLCS